MPISHTFENPIAHPALVANYYYQTPEELEEHYSGNIAYKATYCDGGQSEGEFGFNGLCSEGVMRHNVKGNRNHVWCRQDDEKDKDYEHSCPCCRYVHGKISKRELEHLFRDWGHVCCESALLRDWEVSGGAHRETQDKERNGEGIAIKHAAEEKLCVLTSRMPKDKNDDNRFIFGLFLTEKPFKGGKGYAGMVKAQPCYRMRFSIEQARRLPFWRYYWNPNAEEPEIRICRWGTGLIRYLSDAQSVQILKDAVKVKTGTQDEASARRFLEHYCSFNRIQPDDVWEPEGALTRR